ncbi:MAG: TonB-dependent receptor plug domain-containing protein [Draconibacterium sp.]|nr:TonB-dependent receptor plug domain-containing protein [Draconibacterium sp.]
MPGVSIIVKGTNTGVVTNIDGNYSISAPNAQSVLLFSFVGMQPQEVAINGKSTIDVTLVTSSIGVDEVVVTALGISREKKSLGYSVSSVGGEDISQAGNVNMLKSLDGRVTGVNIVSLSPDPTSSALITVRGATSIAGIQGKDQSNRSQPLYVIDGIPVGSGNVGKLGGIDVGNKMSQLNPNDIETITVLKGASAGALYGSEAGNGVILITTKTGAKSKKGIGVEVVSSTTFESSYKTMPVQNDYFQGERYDSEYYSMEGVSSWGALAGSAEAAKNYTQWDMLPRNITMAHWYKEVNLTE